MLFIDSDVIPAAFVSKVQSYGFILAETAGVEPAREILDCLANSYGYRFITLPELKKFGASNRI